MTSASVAIFKKSVEYNAESTPCIPDDVFEAAQRVCSTKTTELIRSRDGFYVLQYSENGPFKEDLGGEWLPVYIARIEKWSSGGIKKSEMKAFQEPKKA